MKKKLIVFPLSFKNKEKYVIDKFLPDTDDFSSVLYLTSRQTKIEDFKLQLWKTKQKPLIPPYSFTLKSFAGKIVEENSNYRTIDRIEEFFIIYQLLQGSKNAFSVNHISFAEKLAGFIRNIKISHSKVDIPHYKNEIDGFQWRYSRNKQLVLFALDIMEKYQDYLYKNSLADENDLYGIASENINISEYKTLLVDGLYEILPNQESFLKAVIDSIPQVVFVYYCDKDASIDVRKMILEKNLETIKSFSKWETEILPEKEGKTDVCVLSYPSSEEEIKNIAERIRSFLQQGLSLDDILVVFPSMPSYRPLVQRLFQRLDIPFKLTPGYSLSHDPSIVSIFSVFDYIESPGWENIMGVFTSPFFGFDKKEAELFSGESRRVFEGLGFSPMAKWLKKWRNYRLLQSAVKDISLNSDTLENFSENLKHTLEKLKWEPFDNEAGEDLFEILRYMKKDIRVDRKDFVSILSYLFNMFEVEKSKGEGIRVMGVLDSSGIEARVVFFGGATSDDLPVCLKTDEFFIPDALKEKLGLNHFSLMLSRERLDLQRLKKENRELIFTYPVRVKGEAKTKSIMLYDYPEKQSETKNIHFGRRTDFFNVSFDEKKFRDKFFKDGCFQFNVTDMDKIAGCPYRFYLETVEKVRPYKEPVIEEVPRIWGSIIHKTLEDITAPYIGRVIDDEMIREETDGFRERVLFYLEHPENVDANCSGISPIVKNFLKLRADSVLKSFEELIKPHRGHTIKGIEEKHDYTNRHIRFKGKFDRIEFTDDFVEVIDIKTGILPTVNIKNLEQSPVTDSSIFEIKNLQFPIYYLMASKTFQRPVKTIVWALNFDETKATERFYDKFDEKFIPMFEKHIIGFSQALYNGKFSFYPQNNQNCYGCQFKEFCIQNH